MKRIHPDDRALADPIGGTGARPAERVVRIRTPDGSWTGYRAASVRAVHGSGQPVSLLALWGPHSPPAPVAAEGAAPFDEGVDRLFEDVPLGLAVISADGRLRRANARLAGLLGWNASTPPAGSLMDLLAEPDPRRASAAWAPRLEPPVPSTTRLSKVAVIRSAAAFMGAMSGPSGAWRAKGNSPSAASLRAWSAAFSRLAS